MSLFDRVRRVALLLADPRVPKLPRVAVLLAGFYLLWPVDLLPDFVPPVIGYLDDMVVLWLAIRWLVKRDPDRTAAVQAPGPEH